MNEKDLLLLARLTQLLIAFMARQAEQAGLTEEQLFARANEKFAKNEDDIAAFLKELE